MQPDTSTSRQGQQIVHSEQRPLVVQSLCHAQLFATPWTAARQAPPVLHYLSEFAQTHVH